MNTQSIDISLYQKGDIALEDIYKKFKNCFMRYAGCFFLGKVGKDADSLS